MVLQSFICDEQLEILATRCALTWAELMFEQLLGSEAGMLEEKTS